MKQQSLCNLSGLALDYVISSTASWAGNSKLEVMNLCHQLVDPSR